MQLSKSIAVMGAAMAAVVGGAVTRRDYELDHSIEVRGDPFDLKSLYLGSPQSGRRRSITAQDRSRYMPHIGAKERARHAGKPDGPMHKLPPLFRA